MLKEGKKKAKKEKKKKESKGLSNIVATLLIMLVSIVAILIFWSIVRNIVINQTELAKIKNEFFSENIEIKKFNLEGDLINITLEKKGGTTTSSKEREKIETKEVRNLDIISVVDLSGSMLSCNGVSKACCEINLTGAFFPIQSFNIGMCTRISLDEKDICTLCGGVLDDKLSPIKEANKELINLLLESKGSKIGLTAYNQIIIEPYSLNLTDNVNELENKIDSWEAMGNTCICCGINDAVKKLEEHSSDDKVKKIIIMSDGNPNVPCIEQNTGNPSLDAVKAACDAKLLFKENLTIYSVGFGEDANETTLLGVANCGGGKYFSAMNVSELIDVYTTIGEYFKETYETITNVNYLFVVFSNGTNSYTEKISKVPGALEIKTYQTNLSGKLTGEIIKIEIFPVIITDSGKEIIGPPSDVWEK
jgi:hypothetical protein